MKFFNTSRKAYQGNTLVEYALPVALVVVASGVIASSVNIQGMLPDFFASASGATVAGDKITAQTFGAQAVMVQVDLPAPDSMAIVARLRQLLAC